MPENGQIDALNSEIESCHVEIDGYCAEIKGLRRELSEQGDLVADKESRL